MGGMRTALHVAARRIGRARRARRAALAPAVGRRACWACHTAVDVARMPEDDVSTAMAVLHAVM